MSWESIGALVIFVGAYTCIILEKPDRAAAAVLGGALAVFLGFLPYEAALEYVDLDVIFLLIGMMTIVAILGDTGLFEWLAVWVAQRARGHGLLILLGLTTATGFLSAFLDNVTTIVLIAPVTILITQILGLNPVPYLMLEVLFSNVGGAATLIGDPPNVVIASAAGLSFNQFIFNLTPAVAVVCLGLLGAMALRYGGRLTASPAARAQMIRARPARAITDPVRLKRALPIFALTLAGFVVSPVLHVGPGIMAFAGALVMVAVTRTSLPGLLERVEWHTIIFLIGLFLLVGSLDHQGFFENLGHTVAGVTEGRPVLMLLSLLWISGFLSAALGALPVVMALIPLVQTLIQQAPATVGHTELWWALSLGVCMGANGTMVGSAANLVAIQVGRNNQCGLTYVRFMKYGIPVMILSLTVSSAYLVLRYVVLGP